VLDLSDNLIIVQRGNDKWEVGRNKNTPINGDLKRGSSVTIKYKINAADRNAAGRKLYQVTGSVFDLADNVVIIQKGNDKWEIGRNKDTKINGDLKKGSKVTIQYKMTATSVDVKDAGKAKADTKTKTK